MAKPGRNDPCPCGSGKKYKKCCLPLHEESRAKQHAAVSLTPGFTDLDDLSNSVVDLIEAGRLDDAEAACRDLLTRHPDQIDGTERLAAVYEAKGEKKLAAEYYRKAAQFAKGSPGFDQELIDWYSSKAKELEAN
ncbi:MAG: SEC-C metal-binding domain-containing protein [Thermodesulfobacteriota bacterium]